MKLITTLLLVSISIVTLILVTKFAIPYFTNKNNDNNDNKPHNNDKKYKIDNTPMSLDSKDCSS